MRTLFIIVLGTYSASVMPHANKNKKGSILAYSLILLTMIIMIGIGVTVVNMTEKKSASSTLNSDQAYQTAESIGNQAKKRIMTNNNGRINSVVTGIGKGTLSYNETSNVCTISGTYTDDGRFQLQFFNSDGIALTTCQNPVSDVSYIDTTYSNKDVSRTVRIQVPKTMYLYAPVKDGSNKQSNIVFDMSDPANPSKVDGGRSVNNSNGTTSYIANNILVEMEYPLSGGGDVAIAVYDLSDPSKPNLIFKNLIFADNLPEWKVDNFAPEIFGTDQYFFLAGQCKQFTTCTHYGSQVGGGGHSGLLLQFYINKESMTITHIKEGDMANATAWEYIGNNQRPFKGAFYRNVSDGYDYMVLWTHGNSLLVLRVGLGASPVRVRIIDNGDPDLFHFEGKRLYDYFFADFNFYRQQDANSKNIMSLFMHGDSTYNSNTVAGFILIDFDKLVDPARYPATKDFIEKKIAYDPGDGWNVPGADFDSADNYGCDEYGYDTVTSACVNPGSNSFNYAGKGAMAQIGKYIYYYMEKNVPNGLPSRTAPPDDASVNAGLGGGSRYLMILDVTTGDVTQLDASSPEALRDTEGNPLLKRGDLYAIGTNLISVPRYGDTDASGNPIDYGETLTMSATLILNADTPSTLQDSLGFLNSNSLKAIQFAPRFVGEANLGYSTEAKVYSPNMLPDISGAGNAYVDVDGQSQVTAVMNLSNPDFTVVASYIVPGAESLAGNEAESIAGVKYQDGNNLIVFGRKTVRLYDVTDRKSPIYKGGFAYTETGGDGFSTTSVGRHCSLGGDFLYVERFNYTYTAAGSLGYVLKFDLKKFIDNNGNIDAFVHGAETKIRVPGMAIDSNYLYAMCYDYNIYGSNNAFCPYYLDVAADSAPALLRKNDYGAPVGSPWSPTSMSVNDFDANHKIFYPSIFPVTQRRTSYFNANSANRTAPSNMSNIVGTGAKPYGWGAEVGKYGFVAETGSTDKIHVFDLSGTTLVELPSLSITDSSGSSVSGTITYMKSSVNGNIYFTLIDQNNSRKMFVIVNAGISGFRKIVAAKGNAESHTENEINKTPGEAYDWKNFESIFVLDELDRNATCSIAGKYIYLSNYGYSGWGLQPIDVSNPMSYNINFPRFKSPITQIEASRMKFINETRKGYLVNPQTGKLILLDVNNPSTPQVISNGVVDLKESGTNIAFNVDVSGDYVVVTERTVAEVFKTDFSNLANPIKKLSGSGGIRISSSTNATDGGMSVSAKGQFAYVTSPNDKKIYVIDFADPTNFGTGAFYASCGNLNCAPRANVVYGSYLYIIVTDPNNYAYMEAWNIGNQMMPPAYSGKRKKLYSGGTSMAVVPEKNRIYFGTGVSGSGAIEYVDNIDTFLGWETPNTISYYNNLGKGAFAAGMFSQGGYVYGGCSDIPKCAPIIVDAVNGLYGLGIKSDFYRIAAGFENQQPAFTPVIKNKWIYADRDDGDGTDIYDASSFGSLNYITNKADIKGNKYIYNTTMISHISGTKVFSVSKLSPDPENPLTDPENPVTVSNDLSANLDALYAGSDIAERGIAGNDSYAYFYYQNGSTATGSLVQFRINTTTGALNYSSAGSIVNDANLWNGGGSAKIKLYNYNGRDYLFVLGGSSYVRVYRVASETAPVFIKTVSNAAGPTYLQNSMRDQFRDAAFKGNTMMMLFSTVDAASNSGGAVFFNLDVLTDQAVSKYDNDPRAATNPGSGLFLGKTISYQAGTWLGGSTAKDNAKGIAPVGDYAYFTQATPAGGTSLEGADMCSKTNVVSDANNVLDGTLLNIGDKLLSTSKNNSDNAQKITGADSASINSGSYSSLFFSNNIDTDREKVALLDTKAFGAGNNSSCISRKQALFFGAVKNSEYNFSTNPFGSSLAFNMTEKNNGSVLPGGGFYGPNAVGSGNLTSDNMIISLRNAVGTPATNFPKANVGIIANINFDGTISHPYSDAQSYSEWYASAATKSLFDIAKAKNAAYAVNCTTVNAMTSVSDNDSIYLSFSCSGGLPISGSGTFPVAQLWKFNLDRVNKQIIFDDANSHIDAPQVGIMGSSAQLLKIFSYQGQEYLVLIAPTEMDIYKIGLNQKPSIIRRIIRGTGEYLFPNITDAYSGFVDAVHNGDGGRLAIVTENASTALDGKLSGWEFLNFKNVVDAVANPYVPAGEDLNVAANSAKYVSGEYAYDASWVGLTSDRVYSNIVTIGNKSYHMKQKTADASIHLHIMDLDAMSLSDVSAPVGTPVTFYRRLANVGNSLYMMDAKRADSNNSATTYMGATLIEDVTVADFADQTAYTPMQFTNATIVSNTLKDFVYMIFP